MAKTAVALTAFTAALVGFAYHGIGGGLLGIGVVGVAAVIAERYLYTLVVLLLLFATVYFWNVGL